MYPLLDTPLVCYFYVVVGAAMEAVIRKSKENPREMYIIYP
jgi:hypothetical protein